MTIPRSCMECPYEKCCNTARYLPDCRFATTQREFSLKEKVTALFSKIFN